MTRSSLLWIRGALALVSLFSALPIVRAAAQSTTDHSAVWIETVEPDSALARAGLLVGDALSQWQGLEAAGRIRQQGRLTSMADWHRLVHEQAPRGAVRLIGRRAGAAITFEVQPGPWLATVRPQLSLELATAYTNGRKRLQNGERPAAIDAWQAAAEQAIRHGEATAAAWLLRTIGEAHTAARQWQLAQAAYEAARRQTTTPTGEALLRHAAARAYADQGVMDRATAELEQGLALWHTVPDAELSVAACLVELAELARRQRQLERAQSLLDEALASQAALAPGSLAMAESLSLRGTLSFYRGDLEAAGASFQQALDLQQRLAPAGLEIATSHNRLGAVAWRLGRLDEAKGHFERALAIRQALAPNSLDVAGTLNNLALVTQRLSDFDATEAALQRAAALYQSLAPNTLAQANTTTNLGVLALTRGHLEEASKYYRRALEIRQAIAPESLETAASWSNLGIVAMEQGDLAVAARYYRKALDIRRKVAPESIDLTNSLTTLGMLARRRGETREALARGHEALQILERIAPDSPEVASTLSSLGLAAWQHGDLAQAWDFTSRALSRHPADAPDTIDRATFFNNAAMIALDLGKLEAAEEHGLRALALYRRFAPGGLKMAATLFNLGQVAARRETLEEAWRYHHQALQIRQQLAPDSLLPAESLNLIAKLNRARGHHNDVSGPFERSITTLERQVGKLGGTQHRREGYRARYELLYRDFIAHLIDRSAWEEAFDVLERFRARSFLAMLAERDLGFDREAPEPLRRARRRIAVQYDRVQDQLAQLSPVLAGEKTEDLLRQLEALRRERDDVAVAIREASPAGRTQPLQILTLAEARAVLDPGTVALSYSVGKQRTTLFVLRSDGDLESHTLTIDRDDLERQVELFRRLIQQQAPPAAGGTEAADREELGAQLYAALVRPAEARVINARRLLIIPDGPLHMLPFGALQDAEGRYLVTRAALHTALSMSVYAQQLEARTADRQAATFDFVAFGDPLVGQEPTGPQLVASDPLDLPIQRSSRLERLAASRREIESIGALFGEGSRRIHLGAAATEDQVRRDAHGARYLHFATHGLLDPRYPLDSGLVLTRATRPNAHGNGFLQAWEVFEGRRIDAELVVLSACDTGLGEIRGGEGLIGLTRAFHYAGARSVLSSLWRVDDDATADLMLLFYRYLRAGLTKAEALRAAQQDLLLRSGSDGAESPDFSEPYFWAAFQLHGDWR